MKWLVQRIDAHYVHIFIFKNMHRLGACLQIDFHMSS